MGLKYGKPYIVSHKIKDETVYSILRRNWYFKHQVLMLDMDNDWRDMSYMTQQNFYTDDKKLILEHYHATKSVLEYKKVDLASLNDSPNTAKNWYKEGSK
jgi:hypothetical protein